MTYAASRPHDDGIPSFVSPFRHVLWATALAAGLGAAYSEMQVWQRCAQALDIYIMARGAVTGALIGGILTAFDALVLNAPLSASLRRAPFSVHVRERDQAKPESEQDHAEIDKGLDRAWR